MNFEKTPEHFRTEPKEYFHQNNYARFIFDLREDVRHPCIAKPIEFANHRYVTDDVREQAQLDVVADRPGTFIYTKTRSEAAGKMAKELQDEATAAILRTAAAADAAAGRTSNSGAPIVPANVAINQGGVAITGIAAAALPVQPVNSAAAEALANLTKMEQPQ